MEEDEDKDDTKRKSRNLSEKKRRDQFNLLVNELSAMVSLTSRKMDKSTVLKSTIAVLKNHNEIAKRSRAHEIQENWKPSFLPNEEFTHLILEALEGFIMVFSSTGKICYASESITSLLGHLPNDLLTTTIYDIVYEEDQSDIYNIMLNPPKTIIDPEQSAILPENQVTFICHIRRGVTEDENVKTYEYVQFTGYFRDNAEVIEESSTSKKYSGYSGEADTRLIFVGTGRLMTPQIIKEMSIVDSSKSEFTSRHSLEWKFLFMDHRASPIIGYLPIEVLGTSGYDYYHFDDLDNVVACHQALMQKGEGTSCYYRFLTKGNLWIWLQTRFYITYHQWNSKPEFVVCTHRVVNYNDVMKRMRKNNNSSKIEIDDNDSTITDRKIPTSSSMMATSPWSSKSSRVSKTFAPTQDSSNTKIRRFNSYQGHDSDSTSMSADSPLNHQSMRTPNSTISQRSKSRQSVSHLRSSSTTHSSSQQSYIQPQFSLPHPQPQSQQQNIINPSPLTNTVDSPAMSILPPMSTQIMSHHQHRPLSTLPFVDQTQFMTSIPVQPIIATSTTFSTVPIQQSSDYVHSNVVLTSAQNQIQDHLQRKHEELQQLIVQQQDELRRVSEQLFIARYGIVPSVVNVAIPFSRPMITNDGSEHDMITSTSLMSQNSYQNLTSSDHHQINHQHLQVPGQLQQQQQQQLHHQQQQLQQQQQLHQHQQHQQMLSQQHHPSPERQVQNNLHIEQPMDADQHTDEMMSYMQHQTQNQNQNHNQQQHEMQIQEQLQQQQMISNNNDEFGMMPFQMLNQQAQVLFTNNNSNK